MKIQVTKDISRFSGRDIVTERQNQEFGEFVDDIVRDRENDTFFRSEGHIEQVEKRLANLTQIVARTLEKLVENDKLEMEDLWELLDTRSDFRNITLTLVPEDELKRW